MIANEYTLDIVEGLTQFDFYPSIPIIGASHINSLTSIYRVGLIHAQAFEQAMNMNSTIVDWQVREVNINHERL